MQMNTKKKRLLRMLSMVNQRTHPDSIRRFQQDLPSTILATHPISMMAPDAHEDIILRVRVPYED